ncbi:MAG: DUF3179 domain-containing protein [Burkholderiales bacterium]|nr:DUF3179 domain-containing protein [Anaerolineae bacterium]
MSLTAAKAQLSCFADEAADGLMLRFSILYWPETDFCQHSVPYSEIISGGAPPDGIPPIDDPVFESIDAAREWLQPQSPVIALEINDNARAYPLAILIWHEIANDVVGGVPVAVTFCPLCNASLVFDRRVEGEILRFGVSGNLRNSDMIMWDDRTQSWWQQFTGEGIVGSHTGDMLTLLPSQVVGFGDFAAQYPDGQVLSRETGSTRSYGTNPYIGYDSAAAPFLFEGELDDRLAWNERVLAGTVAYLVGEPETIAYPFSILSEERVINDIRGGLSVVAIWQDGMASALDGSSIDDSRLVGTAALYSRELNDETLTFSVDENGVIRDDQTGSAWNVFGTSTEGELAGSQLRQLSAAPHFWFAWVAFAPDTTVYGVS